MSVGIRRTRKKRRRVVLSLLLVIALAGGAGAARHVLSPAAAASPEAPEPLTVEAVQGTVVVTVDSPALAEPYRIRVIRAPNAGTVVSVPAQGANVVAGAPLVRFDTADLDRQVARAEISLAEAELRLARAQADLASARRLVVERESLYAAGATSREQLDAAEDRLLTAERDLRSAELAVDRAGIDLESAERDRESATIRAPFDGTVLSVEVDEGERASQNATLLTVADLSRLRFTAEIDEWDIGRVLPNMPVTVRSDVLGDDVLRARIDSISPSAQIVNNIPVFRVTAAADNADGLWKAGMTADMGIRIARESGIVIPSGAVSYIQGEPHVYVEVPEYDSTASESGSNVAAANEVPASTTPPGEGAPPGEGSQEVPDAENASEGASSDTQTEGDATTEEPRRFEARPVTLGLDDGMNIVVHEGLEPGEQIRIPLDAGALPVAASEPADRSEPSSAIPLPGAGTTGGAPSAPPGGGTPGGASGGGGGGGSGRQ